MGLTTWKDAPDGKVLRRDIGIAKNYLNEKELSRLNRLVTMFIDYEKEYEAFRVKQDKEYISEFDREIEKYLKGDC